MSPIVPILGLGALFYFLTSGGSSGGENAPPGAGGDLKKAVNTGDQVGGKGSPVPKGEVLGTYVVQANDTESSIAKKLTGDASRYPELSAVNPQKMVTYHYQFNHFPGSAYSDRWIAFNDYRGPLYVNPNADPADPTSLTAQYRGPWWDNLTPGEKINIPASWAHNA